MDKKLVLFESTDHKAKIEVATDGETVWLTRNQISELFERDIKTIGKHINNALEEELLGMSTVAKFATVQVEGGRKIQRQIEHYNLDAILSVGYRVKSSRGIEFRRWANTILKSYIVDGYAINKARVEQLGTIIDVLKRSQDSLESKQILDIIETYSDALKLLDDYDHERIEKPSGTVLESSINYDECRKIIDTMSFASESPLFGQEKDNSFKSSINAIYQTFNGIDMYPTLEEKAAQLLYFIVKNHSFIDGNKRIGAAIFLHFLDKNKFRRPGKDKIIDSSTLVALTIMTAESNPKEKDAMVNLVMNFLS